MLHLRTIILVSCLAMPAVVAAQDLASRPRAPGTAVPGEPRMAAAQRPLPLSAPSGGGTPAKTGGAGRLAAGSPGPSLFTMLASLAMVVGLFLLAAWALRKGMPSAGRTLPIDVVEVLGRVSLAPRQPAQLVRIGQKLILVSLSSAGVRTLTEITDPAEVDRLAGLCRQAHPQSSTAAFRHVFQQFARQPVRGFLDDEHSAEVAAARSAGEEAAS
ncbi:MAG TPA: flagellar biosynthetic protein FliO [Pirellulales bacterium]|jgi:flagellar biogenesis protein FliO|nr:flagellar biosynthetic protein FliO [Pirellulales bacterium]